MYTVPLKPCYVYVYGQFMVFPVPPVLCLTREGRPTTTIPRPSHLEIIVLSTDRDVYLQNIVYFFTNLKNVWENFVFYFCANVARFSKNIFICKDWTFKKIVLEGRGFRGGSDEILLWLVFHLSPDPQCLEDIIYFYQKNVKYIFYMFRIFCLNMRAAYFLHANKCMHRLNSRQTNYTTKYVSFVIFSNLQFKSVENSVKSLVYLYIAQ